MTGGTRVVKPKPMTQAEKDRLLALLDRPARWCQGAEARDARGEAVRYNAPEAVAWDIVGGMCYLFGWDRSLAIFAQAWRQITKRASGREAIAMDSTAVRWLQDFNDESKTDYTLVITRLRGLRVRSEAPPRVV